MRMCELSGIAPLVGAAPLKVKERPINLPDLAPSPHRQVSPVARVRAVEGLELQIHGG